MNIGNSVFCLSMVCLGRIIRLLILLSLVFMPYCAAKAKDKPKNNNVKKTLRDNTEKSIHDISGMNIEQLRNIAIQLGIGTYTDMKMISDSMSYIKYGSIYNRLANVNIIKTAKFILEKEYAKVQKSHKKVQALIKEYEAKLLAEKTDKEAKKAKMIVDPKVLKELANIYSNMPPKSAAAIMQELDLAIIEAIYPMMDSSKFSLILGNMQPNKAKEITTKIYNKKVPKDDKQ